MTQKASFYWKPANKKKKNKQTQKTNKKNKQKTIDQRAIFSATQRISVSASNHVRTRIAITLQKTKQKQ